MRLLVLGGTVFLGRHVAAGALQRGHEVTLFHRGRHGGELVPEPSMSWAIAAATWRR